MLDPTSCSGVRHADYPSISPPMTEIPPELRETLQGRYDVVGELGRGGMATVYRAVDLRHQRDVAIKVLHAALGREEDVQRFEREVTTTARLNHPHILPLFEAGRAGPMLFYVMPVVEGDTLRTRIEHEGAIEIGEAVSLAVHVARALGHAHSEAVVHRDVKPANILMHGGQPVIADFGISRLLDASTRLTADGHSVGTPHYMSPEQVDASVEPDGRADQYALACVLFEMLTSTPPFPGQSARAVITAHLVQPAPRLTDRSPSFAALDRVVTRALAKEPGDRYPDMEAFAGALSEAIAPAHPAAPRDDAPPGLLVLPFANLSPDPDNEYFSDGLTEEVISDLSQIAGLRVISRTSAIRLKNDPRDLRTIASDLDVRYLLEGGVRKAGDALRITARLIDASDDGHLWSERFSGRIDDVFEIQENVSRAVVAALRLRLSPAEDRALSDRPIADPRAYESFLRARYEAWRFSPEGLERATRFIETALELVGDNALLWATLGHIRAMYLESGLDSGPEAHRRLEEITDKVSRLDPDSVRGHWLRTFNALQKGDLAGALTAGAQAERADPDDPDTLVLLAYVFANAGRTARAREVVERAVQLDPLTPVTRLLPGFVATLDGRFADAIEPYRVARTLDPDSPFTAVFYGWALAHAGEVPAALQQLDAGAAQAGEGPFAEWARALACGLRGEPRAAARAIGPAFASAAQGNTMFARGLADCLALAGKPDAALDALERAVDLGLLNRRYIAEYDPFLESIRSHPGFALVLEAVDRALAALPV